MDIRELNLFLHLCGTLHFGQTSQACNITRSGLTRTIQRLEQDLGEKLFLRNNRSVSLTRAGVLFREYAADVVQRYRALQAQITVEDCLAGEIVLYCSVTAILSILPAIITRFRSTYPAIHLNLATGDAAMALPKLENREADITIAALPDRLPPHIHFLKMLETPLIFIAPRSPMYRNLEPVEDHLQTIPLIMPERGLSRTRCEKWYALNDRSPTIYAYVGGNEALIAMVAMGCGIGVVPQLVLDNSPMKEHIRTLDVSPALEPFTVGACTTRSALSGPAIRAFWEIAERVSNPDPTKRGMHENDPDNQ